MEEYPHLHFNNSNELNGFGENGTYPFECNLDDQHEFTLSCRKDWETVNQALGMCMEGSAKANGTLSIVLVVIGIQCMMIVGLLFYIYSIKKKLKEYFLVAFYENNLNSTTPINKNGLDKNCFYNNTPQAKTQFKGQIN